MSVFSSFVHCAAKYKLHNNTHSLTVNPPTPDDILEICKETPLKVNAPPDSLHDEVKAVEEVFESVLVAGSTADAWCKFFQKKHAPNLLTLLQYA